MTSFCCTPICTWYVSMTEGPGCPPGNGDQLITDICCCTCSYCFCGPRIDDRVSCCNELFQRIDNSFNYIFCFCCIFLKQRQELKLTLQREKNQHELNILKIKSSNTMSRE